MVKTVESDHPLERHRRQRSGCNLVNPIQVPGNHLGTGLEVGRCLRELRTRRGLSIRFLAKQSGLNANTLSLIENSKTSPSVSTLQQLANALEVPVTAFFETHVPKYHISYQKAECCPKAAFAHGTLEDLGVGLTLQGGQPFRVVLKPKADSGSTLIVHTGYEFVFCLEGHLSYTIEDRIYALNPGDSLLFEACLPHGWQNTGETIARSLLVLCPTDKSDHPTRSHFKPVAYKQDLQQGDLYMKIAVITDDSKTISQHFGRANYYLVATVENGQIVNRELRNKLGHSHFVNQPHSEEQPGQPHGMDAVSHNKHMQMAEAIADCEALLCRGMGMGAYESMKVRGIRPVVTDIASIDEAVMAYIHGTIVDQIERLH